MMLNIQKCNQNVHKLEVSFYGTKKDLMQCIIALLKIYFE